MSIENAVIELTETIKELIKKLNTEKQMNAETGECRSTQSPGKD